MVVVVAVVIPKHSTVVHATDPMIDVSKAVPNNLAIIRLPHFLFQLRTLPWPRQRKFCVECFRDLRGLLGCFLPHYSSIPQKGSYKPQLKFVRENAPCAAGILVPFTSGTPPCFPGTTSTKSQSPKSTFILPCLSQNLRFYCPASQAIHRSATKAGTVRDDILVATAAGMRRHRS